MCDHVEVDIIEEEVAEERWEGDLYVQDIFSWVVCRECGDDFACKAA